MFYFPGDCLNFMDQIHPSVLHGEVAMSVLKPREAVPRLEVSTLRHGTWTLDARQPRQMQMIVFYRGFHCQLCKRQLPELDRNVENFAARGVDVIAISTDTLERALKTQDTWNLQNLTVGYGLPIAEARKWGLFISTALTENEPAEFSEPGLFLVEPCGVLYGSIVGSMPFARPAIGDILSALDFIVKVNYPARGEH
jgi:peroxiredoxin